jgi:hypothetical protein
MGAGASSPKLLSGTLRLTAAVLVGACWLAAPAGAAGVLDGQPAAVDAAAASAAAVSEQLGSTATSAGASASGGVGAVTATRPVRGAVKTVAAARPVSTVAETAAAVPPVHPAADAVAAVGSGVRPAAGEAARTVRDGAGAAIDRAGGPPSGGDGPKPAPALRDTRPEAGGATAQAARLLAVLPDAAQRPDGVLQPAPLAELPAPLTAPTSLDPAPSGAAPAAVPADAAAPAPPSSPDPAPAAGGGAALSAGAASFLLGGLAVLLATLSLAGPALRRRLPRLTVTAWPSAFVPLLERPG